MKQPISPVTVIVAALVILALTAGLWVLAGQRRKAQQKATNELFRQKAPEFFRKMYPQAAQKGPGPMRQPEPSVPAPSAPPVRR